MSNVIKGCELVLAQPKVIDTLDLNIIVPPQDDHEELQPLVTPVDIEKDELEKLKQESQHVLKDTEKMVMELLEKARDEAKTIIGNAQEEADSIRAQVFEEAKTIRKKAEEEGYQQGLKQAQQEIEADRQLSLQQSKQIVEEARQTKLTTMRSTETDIIRLVLVVARKIIADEVHTNPDVIVNVVREAINYLDNPQNITVFVNTHDLEPLLAAINSKEILEVGSNQVNIDVVSDDRMDQGGCLIDSDIGRVDARLQTRLDCVERAVQEVTADE